MSLKEVQEEVNNWANQFNPPYWPTANQFYRLTEEVGEVGRELNHKEGVKKKKSDEKPSSLNDELADVLFTLLCIANSNNINLDEAFRNMMDTKIYGRDKNRYDSTGKSKEN